MVHPSHDEPSPGPSCVTVTIEMSFHFNCFVRFCLSCLPLLVLIMIIYRSYLLWLLNKIECMHAGDRSLSPRMPAWSLALLMSMTPSTCPQALPPYPELQVLPELKLDLFSLQLIFSENKVLALLPPWTCAPYLMQKA